MPTFIFSAMDEYCQLDRCQPRHWIVVPRVRLVAGFFRRSPECVEQFIGVDLVIARVGFAGMDCSDLASRDQSDDEISANAELLCRGVYSEDCGQLSGLFLWALLFLQIRNRRADKTNLHGLTTTDRRVDQCIDRDLTTSIRALLDLREVGAMPSRLRIRPREFGPGLGDLSP